MPVAFIHPSLCLSTPHKRMSFTTLGPGVSLYPPVLFFPLFSLSSVPVFLFCYHHLWSTAELTCLQGKQPPLPFPAPSVFPSSSPSIPPSLSCALPWHWRDQFTRQQLRQASFVPGLPPERAFFTSGDLLTAYGDIECLIALPPNFTFLFFSGSLSC